MVRRFQPPVAATVSVRSEPAFSFLTFLSFTTLVLYYDEGENRAARAFANTLRSTGEMPSRTFDALFGHGFGLRDSLAVLLEPNAQYLCDATSLLEYMRVRDAAWWTKLVELARFTGLDFADVTLPDDSIHLSDPQSMSFILEYIAENEPPEVVSNVASLLADPGDLLRDDVLHAMTVTMRGWQEPPPIEDVSFPEQHDHLGAFRQLTGRNAPHGEVARLTGASRLIFLATTGLGQELSISYFPDDVAVVAFEPQPSSSDGVMPLDDAAGLFDALANNQRLRILDALGRQGEMFGLELAEALDIPQASLSNHLAMLERARLVGRRPAGRRIYYHLQVYGLDAATEVLKSIRPIGERS